MLGNNPNQLINKRITQVFINVTPSPRAMWTCNHKGMCLIMK